MVLIFAIIIEPEFYLIFVYFPMGPRTDGIREANSTRRARSQTRLNLALTTEHKKASD